MRLRLRAVLNVFMFRSGNREWRLHRTLLGGLTACIGLALVLGAVGQVVRDRSVLLALLMYVPLPAVGASALVLDLLRRGRSVPRTRFALSAAGLAALVGGSVPMVGTRRPEPAPPSSVPVTVLHWNVQWGGRGWARWLNTADQIVARDPDVVVLSEAPPEHRVFEALHRLGRGWTAVNITSDPGDHYWYNPVVCSRWPLKLERRAPVRNGAAMLVVAAVRGRDVRLLVADGKSDPRILRTPMLHDLAAACEAEAALGRPVDVVVGDFNAVGRSVGFDRLRSGAGGRVADRRASDYCGGWRATWPFPVPMYDIDHAWVRRDVAVLGCELFSDRGTDHRGQLVRLAVPVTPGGD